MNKWLIAGISVPLLLSGCGGGGEGGGNSSPRPPAVKSYTWQFVQMKSQPQATMNQFCGHSNATVFSVDDSDADSSKWLYTYAVLAPTITAVNVYNSDGSQYTEGNLDEFDIHQSQGTLTFTENDVPDGGYIAVVDEDNVLIVKEDALSDALIKVTQNQGQQACYTAGPLIEDANEKKINVATFSGVSETSIETYIDGKFAKDSGTIKSNLTVLNSDETTLILGYTSSGEVNGYRYVSKSELSNASSSQQNTVNLDQIFDQVSVDFNEPATSTFVGFNISSIRSGFTFDWFNWSALSNTYQVSAPLSSPNKYAAEYKGQLNGWNVEHNSVLDGSSNRIDLDLAAPSASPAFDCSGTFCKFFVSDITSDAVHMSKLEFDVGAAKYTLLSKGSEFIVPKITGIAEPVGSTPLSVSMLMMENANSSMEKAFTVLGNTRNYTPRSDYIDFIAKPSDDLNQQVILKSNTYTIISN
ncbi:hypothetical protein EGH82_01540 [Vibrio ponticus]|uniref:54K polar flagellar sheath protein A n=1 Tax=Vibrio ponticus TaxID=265668 RepID=A0A3N3E733_9VIBR|nr:hypothetical protein [Vibrio ponticus]ROV62389.1 hypothetical protein EGH82_01540 [Vibrio ponticus]